MIQLSVSDRIGAETISTLKMVSKIACNRLSRQHGFRSHSSLSVVRTTYLGKVVFCPRLVSHCGRRACDVSSGWRQNLMTNL